MVKKKNVENYYFNYFNANFTAKCDKRMTCKNVTGKQ